MTSPAYGVRRVLALVLLLLIGSAIGAGAVYVAESVIAARVGRDARTLDALAGLSETAAFVEAATGQALVLSAQDDRAGELAQSEARSVLEVFVQAIDVYGDDDPTLVRSAERFASTATGFLDRLDAGDPPSTVEADAGTLELAYRSFVDVVASRRAEARTSLAASGGDSGRLALIITALIVFALPLLVLALTLRWVRSRWEQRSIPTTIRVPPAQPRPRTEPPTPAIPTAIAADLDARTRTDEGRMSDAGLVTSIRNLVVADQMRGTAHTSQATTVELSALMDQVASGFTGLTSLPEPVQVIADPEDLALAVSNLVMLAESAGASQIALVAGREASIGSLSVAGRDLVVGDDVLKILRHGADGYPEDPTSLAAAVTKDLVEAMSGRLAHHRTEDMTLVTIELPLADHT